MRFFNVVNGFCFIVFVPMKDICACTIFKVFQTPCLEVKLLGTTNDYTRLCLRLQCTALDNNYFDFTMKLIFFFL